MVQFVREAQDFFFFKGFSLRTSGEILPLPCMLSRHEQGLHLGFSLITGWVWGLWSAGRICSVSSLLLMTWDSIMVQQCW